MNTYTIKVALRDISPMIWRRFKIQGNTSIAQLHHIIQIAMAWDDTHLHCFRIYAKDYGIGYAGGLSFMDDARKVLFDQFKFDVGDKFTYQYNFYEARLCDIRIEAIAEPETMLPQPLCLSGDRVFYEYPARHEFDVFVWHDCSGEPIGKKGNEKPIRKSQGAVGGIQGAQV